MQIVKSRVWHSIRGQVTWQIHLCQWADASFLDFVRLRFSVSVLFGRSMSLSTVSMCVCVYVNEWHVLVCKWCWYFASIGSTTIRSIEKIRPDQQRVILCSWLLLVDHLRIKKRKNRWVSPWSSVLGSAQVSLTRMWNFSIATFFCTSE